MAERRTIYLDDALEAIRNLPNAGIHWFVSAEAVFDALLKLPSAHPERKKGKWIDCNWSIRCSECDYSMPWAVRNFCPNCGADMREEGEQE